MKTEIKHTFLLNNGFSIPRLGQGTWRMAESADKRRQEIDALRLGIELGMTLIDTAEMYAEGGAETIVGEAINSFNREELFIVSKVYPHNAGKNKIFSSCEASMRRMKTDYLDMYLLHWRGEVPLAETVECMEDLVRRGRIRCWGVSNFNTDSMEDIWAVPGGNNCAANQILYHIACRGPEFSLMPWMEQRNLAMMAYCPIARAGKLGQDVLESLALNAIAKEKGVSPVLVLLAFTLRRSNMISIPKSSSAAHTAENAQGLDICLSEEDIARLSSDFPSPCRKTKLDII